MDKYILALALNPAIDRTVQVPGFRPGATCWVVQGRTDPGGKGINVARVARALGAPVQVLGFLGEGNGDLIRRHLAACGIPAHFIAVAGDNRVNLKIIDQETNTLTEVNDLGFHVGPGELQALLAVARDLLAGAGVVVLTGSLPPGVPDTVYRDLVQQAAATGVPVVLDAEGPALAAALAAGPALVKVNHAEAGQVLGRTLATRDQVVAAAQGLRALGARCAVVSMGAAGAALASDGGSWWATPPRIRPGSAVGAGDAMTAGFALGLLRGQPLAEVLALATAAGAATASLEGTQTCSRDHVAALLPQVVLAPVQPDVPVEPDAKETE